MHYTRLDDASRWVFFLFFAARPFRASNSFLSVGIAKKIISNAINTDAIWSIVRTERKRWKLNPQLGLIDGIILFFTRYERTTDERRKLEENLRNRTRNPCCKNNEILKDTRLKLRLNRSSYGKLIYSAWWPQRVPAFNWVSCFFVLYIMYHLREVSSINIMLSCHKAK